MEISKETGFSRVDWGLTIFLAVLVGFLLVRSAWNSSSNDSPAPQRVTVSEPIPTTTALPTQTPQTTVDAYPRDYEVGEVYAINNRNVQLCKEPEPPNGWCNLSLHARDGDCIQVIGHPRYFEQRKGTGWYWPIKVVLGSVYTEGETFWFPETEFIFPADPGDCTRQAPEFGVGDVVWANYNFIIAQSPDGPPAQVDEL